MLLVPWLRDSRLAETTLTLALPYLVYTLCERYFDVSGVTAVVVAGLVVNAQGRRRLAPENQAFLQDVWQQLAFWAGSMVFILASMLVPRLMIGIDPYDLLLIGVVALAAIVARAAVLFGLLPLLSAARLARPVSRRYQFVIMWGAMRGAVTLALALGVTENRSIDPEIQRFVAILATGFVLFTLFVNGTTLRPVIHLLKLDRLSPLDQALRHQVLTLALGRVRDAIREAAAGYRIGETPTADVLGPYQERIAEASVHTADERDRRSRPDHPWRVRAGHPGTRADSRAFPPSLGIAPDPRAPARRRRGDHGRRPRRRPPRLRSGGAAPAGVRRRCSGSRISFTATPASNAPWSRASPRASSCSWSAGWCSRSWRASSGAT